MPGLEDASQNVMGSNPGARKGIICVKSPLKIVYVVISLWTLNIV